MHQLSLYNPTTFIAELDRRLADKAATFSLPADYFLARLSPKQLNAFLDTIAKHEATIPGYIEDAATLILTGGSPLGYLKTWSRWMFARRKTNGARNKLTHALNGLILTRQAVSLEDREQALMRAMAVLFANKVISADTWLHFYAHIVNHNPIIRPDPALAADPFAQQAIAAFPNLSKLLLDDRNAALAHATQIIASHAKSTPALAKASQAVLAQGARFMSEDDIAGARTLSLTKTHDALLLGTTTDTRKPVYFTTAQSLLTVASPGSGKSQAHVIPNLLTYPGSAFVLDVKSDELWNATAAYRKKHFGPVYRFAPSDIHGRTHRYNPFDFIGTNPLTTAKDAEVFSFQVVTKNPKAHDPFWENRGRDILWGFATLVAFSNNKPYRTLETLAELAHIRTALLDPDDPTSFHPDTAAILGLMHRYAKMHNIPDLTSLASAIEDGIRAGSDRLASVLEVMRQHISAFGRSVQLRNAMSTSDWHPRHLRTRPGTTVYLCVPETELTAYAPIIRLMFHQHMVILKDVPMAASERPITFFLDEMPQLGNFDSIPSMQDTGRSYGLRLWMFAQSLHQIRFAFGENRAATLIDNASVKCYMRPDPQTAEKLSRAAGHTKNVFTGKQEPLMEPSDISGPRYRDNIIAMASSEFPLILNPVLADKTMADKFLSPPLVPVAKPLPSP